MKLTPTLLVAAMALTLSACSSDSDNDTEQSPVDPVAPPTSPMTPDPDSDQEPTDPDAPVDTVDPDAPGGPDTPGGELPPVDAEALSALMSNGTSLAERATVWRCVANPGQVLIDEQVPEYTIGWFDDATGFYRNNVSEIGLAGEAFTWMSTSSTQLDYVYTDSTENDQFAFTQINFSSSNEFTTVVTRNEFTVLDERTCARYDILGNAVTDSL